MYESFFKDSQLNKTIKAPKETSKDRRGYMRQYYLRRTKVKRAEGRTVCPTCGRTGVEQGSSRVVEQ